jgi:ADP-heptose:LPS heptosyltransferase
MLTAAVRDLHHWYPGHFSTDTRTACPELWENNPHLTALADDDPESEVIDCSYPLINHCNKAPFHCLHGFIEFLNDRLCLAIKPTLFKGDIHLTEQEKAWCSQVREVTRDETPFWIVAAGGKYDVTVKWWQSERYQEVVNHYGNKIQFVQVGHNGHHHPKLDNVIDLRGRTNLRELVRLVYHSQGVLCSVTALMHLAAAVETKGGHRRPCVVMAGGREPAHWEAYPDHQFIHTNGALRCCSKGGCWKDRTVRLRDGDKRDRHQSLCVDVAQGIPRCMDLITPTEVIGRIKIYFDGGRLKYLTSRQCVAARRGVVATARNPFDKQALNLHSAGLACEEFIKTIPASNEHFKGRGIVICGGGVKYFTCAWVCVNMLRRFGCRLPVELWHLGATEMDEPMKALLKPLGVECVDALQIRKNYPARILRGWELKAYAILRSRFREVLLLDADNVPVVDPEFLFETPQFRTTGAIFWPDYEFVNGKKAATIWHSCGMRRPNEREFETGQIVVDKQRCWEALSLALWFNENSDFYYHYVHGDKETFHLAFRKLKQPYFLVPKPVQSLEGIMCQHDFNGRRIFQHRNTDKWDFFLHNKRVKGFLFDEECRTYIKQLQGIWDGGIGLCKHKRLIAPVHPGQNRRRSIQVKAVMITCPERETIRQKTLANLARSDWGEAPLHIQVDRGTGDNHQQRQTRCAYLALKMGLELDADYVLFLEDDLDFNRHLRHNLNSWTPLKTGRVTLASLYNPSVRELACDLEHTARVVAPDSVFGSQALVISRRALESVVCHWHEIAGMQDIKISRLAGRLGRPILYHAPSLIQHLGTQSLWKGRFHRARDFDRDWRK